ncbi:hypothetical protein [Pilimelia columellifera]|uniref:hypothetical protein n=1 Tax=Pilimelia columellifera TaxID=706574 RepID=UPI0031E237A7
MFEGLAHELAHDAAGSSGFAHGKPTRTAARGEERKRRAGRPALDGGRAPAARR